MITSYFEKSSVPLSSILLIGNMTVSYCKPPIWQTIARICFLGMNSFKNRLNCLHELPSDKKAQIPLCLFYDLYALYG